MSAVNGGGLLMITGCNLRHSLFEDDPLYISLVGDATETYMFQTFKVLLEGEGGKGVSKSPWGQRKDPAYREVARHFERHPPRGSC
jgi:hypothetical protein